MHTPLPEEIEQSFADGALNDAAMRQALLQSPLPLSITAEDGRILLLNRSWCEASGYSPEQLPTITEWTELAYGTRAEEIRAWIEELFALNRPLEEGEFAIRTAGGEQRIWEFTSAPAGRLADGRRTIVTIARDVTLTSSAVRDLRHAKAGAEESLRAARAAVWEWDLALNRWTFSDSAHTLLGRVPQTIGGEQWLSWLDPADRAALESAAVPQQAERGGLVDCTVQVRPPGGAPRRVRLIGGPTRHEDMAVTRLAGVMIEAGTRAAQKAEREAYQQEAQRWAMEVGDRDRRRVADELHRGLGEQLAGLSLIAKALQQKLEKSGSDAAADANMLLRHLQTAHRHARRLARGLSPVPHEPDGIAHALQELAARCSDLHRVGCTFSAETPVRLHDLMVATSLYHIAQEAVHNAVRHGEPRRILISLSQQPQELVMQIRDDGRGLPQTPPPPAAVGWKLMHHRAKLIGARLQIQNGPAGGVIVDCKVPISDGAGEAAAA